MTTGAVNQQLFEYAMRWQSAAHGGKGRVIDEAARYLGLSRSTLHKEFKNMVFTKRRKRRSDAGTSNLTRDEATTICAVVMEHMRKNNKHLKAFAQAVDECRELGLIKAQRIDPATGEVVMLSTSAIVAGLRLYHMHPKQVQRPAPAISMSSKYPNHCWQIDASRCIMFFLPPDERESHDNGLRFADDTAQYYKNKPANQIKAIRQALWRYVVTDHRSGWVFVDYVTQGETSANLIECLIAAMVHREGEALHGVPNMIMLDPGSANTSAAFKNLCQQLQIRVQVNAVGQPRAKGQVEKSQDLVERNFEAALRTLPADQVRTLEQIRALAARWRRSHNGRAIMRRHGMTRDAAWLHITADQLVVAPAADLMREAATTAPEPRLVNDFLRVSFLGREYDVSHVPNVQNGEKLLICRNVMVAGSAQAIVPGADGHDEYHVLPEVVRDEFGQVGPVIGEAYESHADSPAQKAAKAVELRAMDAQTLEEAQAKRKAKSSFMGGRYDPFVMIDKPVPQPMPRAGTEHAMTQQASQRVLPPLTHIQAAKALKDKFAHWGPRHYQWIVTHYPEGVPADDLATVESALRHAMAPRVLLMSRVA
ncbi:DDE-type integrase/transposase/recombinase [Castellaniella caeni]|uniref:DDE-type integrase/transposase/recombinase n=1 Tax=Castellaniella caeni TaxID=266123 RepID=UPI000C9F12A4|nr:DDE-type integrase/transposase/recombinase [Castellaniella caeni]